MYKMVENNKLKGINIKNCSYYDGYYGNGYKTSQGIIPLCFISDLLLDI